MTNRIAVFLFFVVVCFFVWDAYDNNWDATFFLAKKLSALIEWMAFWR